VKKLTLLILLSVFGLNLHAQTLQWANTMGGGDKDRGHAVAVGADGSVYSTGIFRDTIDLDPGLGTNTLIAAGMEDMYLVKFDDMGNFIWGFGIGSTGTDEGTSVAVDSDGNVYVAGRFSDTVDFDPGPGTAIETTTSSYNLFYAKFTSDGDLIWVNSFGGIGGDIVEKILVDATHNVYIAGRFSFTIDADPGLDSSILTAFGINSAFLGKYDSAGNYLWAHGFGGGVQTIGSEIDLDPSGNVYFTGWFQDSADFDPGPGTTLLTSVGESDIYIAKYNANGDLVWAKSFGGVDNEFGFGIAVDGGGNIYVIGEIRSATDFDPGPDTAYLAPIGASSTFFVKYDGSGNYIWGHLVGEGNGCFAFGIDVDPFGDIYLTGWFGSTVDFDLGPGTAILQSNGNTDIFFAKYDSAANYIWANSVGGFNIDWGWDIVADFFGNFYIAGFFRETVDFDPDIVGTDLHATPTSWEDSYVAKYGPPPPPCEDISYTAQPATCSGGSDGVVTITLASTSPYTYIWDTGDSTASVNTLSSGFYQVTVADGNGCSNEISAYLPDYPLIQTIYYTTICDGDSILFEGAFQTAAGTYHDTTAATNGCDSIAEQVLSIYTVDAATISPIDGYIIANDSAATYQWIDCADNSIMVGYTNQLFIAPAVGSYAAVITSNSCTDTSACTQVLAVGIGELMDDNAMSIYPNPSPGEFRVMFSGHSDTDIKMSIFNNLGQLIHQENIKSINGSTEHKFDLSRHPKGVYTVYVQSESMVATQLLILE